MAKFDDDLQQLFAGEVQERTARLVAGAEALAAVPLDEDALRTMIREGHTIKGTARMMGLTAISDAGKALEEAWRAIGSGEITPDGELAAALALLAAHMASGVGADPATGTPGLAAGMRALRGALRQDDPVRAIEPRPTRPHGDLDGLLGAIDSWAFGETVRVNAAGLFRLINEICRSGRLRGLAEARSPAPRLGGRPHREMTALATLVGAADKALLDLQSQAVDLAQPGRHHRLHHWS
jgi:HPt (histidine-containing phosphotransfer) domain-containing protein